MAILTSLMFLENKIFNEHRITEIYCHSKASILNFGSESRNSRVQVLNLYFGVCVCENFQFQILHLSI